jgi:phosphoglycolate phosphatase-like HAD superfamily hydrolase
VIAFDFDGTIADTMGGLATKAVRLISFTYAIEPDDAYKRYMASVGLPFRDQLEIMFPSHSENDATAEEFLHDQSEVYKTAGPVAGMEYALTSAQRQEITTVIVSSSHRFLTVEWLLKHLPLYSGRIYGREDGRKHEQLMFAALKADERVVLIGDTLTDAGTAERAGCKFVAVTGTFRMADFEACGLTARPDLQSAVQLAALMLRA